MGNLLQLVAPLFLIATFAGIAYLCLAIWRVLAFRTATTNNDFTPPVSILKPICGLEPALYENLRTFCEQEYPQYEVIFGVHSSEDPAIAVIERVIGDARSCVPTLVIGNEGGAANPKIANLQSMMPHARHDIVVIADADMRVDETYLRNVVLPFARGQVGAVTALYRGVPSTGRCSGLAAMFINEQFAPSVLVALMLEPLRYCFGSTMAVRRSVLDAIGGLDALAPYLADDFMLGKLVSDRGFDVVLASTLVQNVVRECTFAEVWTHQLRWARTIRVSRPLGYAGSVVTFAFSMALLYLATSWNLGPGIALILVAGALDVALHHATRARFGVDSPAAPWLAPVRDVLGCAIWVASYVVNGVRWRNAALSIDATGRIR